MDIDIRKILLTATFNASLEREIEGTLGLILIFHNPPETYPKRFAVKTVDPDRLSHKPTYKTLQRFCHELRHWIRYRHHPLILTPFFTAFVQKWPYVTMPYCESNLREYITLYDRTKNISEIVALMVQLLEGICYASRRGLLAHQDLKPENVLLQDLREKFNLPKDYPFTWRVRVADFGLANAYKELGLQSGSRPYLAPEQYEKGSDLIKCDVFACGVILHELLTGRHPIGFVTGDVWPKPRTGQSQQWQHEKKWKQWSMKNEKLLPELRKNLEPFGDLIERTLSVESTKRPDFTEFKSELMDYLKSHDDNAYNNLSLLLDHYNNICTESENSGDDDERYQQRYMELLLQEYLY